ncbi:hypothetical protein HY620_03180, partial [Candidatus Uhrbacteria bacterium]|nr:hypothetical protein [Candidatus Uhrbacteria bacterium]
LIAVVVFTISFSWATIVITPTAKRFTKTFEIPLSGDITQFDPQLQEMPAVIVQQEMEGQGTFATTTTKPVEQNDTGTITVINKTSNRQQLRATTRLLHDSGVLFRTTEYSVVPAGGQAEVRVKLDTPGKESVKSGSNRFTLPALWPGVQNQIIGISFQEDTATEGQKILTQQDVDSGTQEVIQKLKGKFSLLLDANQSKQLTGKTVQFLDAQIVGATPSIPMNSAASQFDVKVKMLMRGVLVDEMDLKSKIKKELVNSISQDQELIGARDQDVHVQLASIEAETKKAILKVSATAGHVRSALSADYDKKKLSGMSAHEIESTLTSYDDITDVEVNFYPFWVTRAPILLDHINVVVRK